MDSWACELSIGTLFEEIRLNGGSVDKPTSQRQTRLGAGRGVSQAKGAACGCLEGHVCMGVRISVFAP